MFKLKENKHIILALICPRALKKKSEFCFLIDFEFSERDNAFGLEASGGSNPFPMVVTYRAGGTMNPPSSTDG